MTETVRCAKEKNVQVAKVSEVHGHAHVAKSIKSTLLFQRHLKRGKNRINR